MQTQQIAILDPVFPNHRFSTGDRIHRQILQRAGRDYRPDALAPTVPALTPRPLRDVPIDHHKAERLLRQVVGRLDPRCRDEGEVGRPMLTQALGHRLAGLAPRDRVGPSRHDLLSRRLQPALIFLRRELLTLMCELTTHRGGFCDSAS